MLLRNVQAPVSSGGALPASLQYLTAPLTWDWSSSYLHVFEWPLILAKNKRLAIDVHNDLLAHVVP